MTSRHKNAAQRLSHKTKGRQDRRRPPEQRSIVTELHKAITALRPNSREQLIHLLQQDMLSSLRNEWSRHAPSMQQIKFTIQKISMTADNSQISGATLHFHQLERLVLIGRFRNYECTMRSLLGLYLYPDIARPFNEAPDKTERRCTLTLLRRLSGAELRNLRELKRFARMLEMLCLTHHRHGGVTEINLHPQSTSNHQQILST